MAERAVGIVGLGLIGGSLARALLARGVRVLGTAHDAEDRRLAARCGVEVTGGVAELAAAMPAAGAPASHPTRPPAPSVVVLAVPLPALGAAAGALLGSLAPDAVVLHAAGLQRPAATGLDAVARARVIGTHPLAGSHEAGFAASRADLFAGAAVWAEERAGDAARACLEWLWACVGARAVEYRSAESHDAAMAWVSHLPQLASTALAAALDTAGMPATLGGPGLRDATRLAASPFPLWQDVLRAAPPETDAALARLADTIAQLRAALARGDGDALAALWERAGNWRTGRTPVPHDRANDDGPDHPDSEETAMHEAGMEGAARW